MTEQEWEDLCDRCGKCCGVGEGVACPGYDVENGGCRDYATRLDKYICLKVTPENVRRLYEQRILPKSCAYVRHVVYQLPPLKKPPKAKFRHFPDGNLNLAVAYAKTNLEWQQCKGDCTVSLDDLRAIARRARKDEAN